MDEDWRAEQATYTGQMIDDIARAFDGSGERRKQVHQVLAAAYRAGVVPFLMYREVADMYLAQLEDIRELLESLRKRGDRGQRARRLERGALFCERLAQIIEALRDKTEQDRQD